MAILKQSTTYSRMFLMVDSTDHVTGKTGLTVTVTLSKAGAAFGAAGATITEVSSGWYKAALTTTDTNTLGDLAFHCTGTAADATDFVDQVSARLIDDLAFPATSGRSITVDASGNANANMVSLGGEAIVSGTVDTSTLAATATAFETSFVVNKDLFTNQGLYWTTGANAGFTSHVSGYIFTGNSKVELILNTALPTVPSNGDAFRVLGRIE